MAKVTITGKDAVRYLVGKYDWNIYCSDYDTLKVLAYRQYRDEDGDLRTDYDRKSEVFLPVRMCEQNYDLVRILLGRHEDELDWRHNSWFEYDSWVGDYANDDDPIITAYKTNEMFRLWFDAVIVDYDFDVQV